MNKKILIIEDNMSVQEVLREFLGHEGYLVDVASDGVEGLRKLAVTGYADIVLLDLRMPRMNGDEFLLTKNADPVLASIPVILISADPGGCSCSGVVDIVRKPIQLQVLIEKLEVHLQASGGAGK